MGKKSYLPHPPHILPHIFDFLSVLAIIRKHLPGVAHSVLCVSWYRACVLWSDTASVRCVTRQTLSNDRLLRLTSCVFSSPYWASSGTLLPTIAR